MSDMLLYKLKYTVSIMKLKYVSKRLNILFLIVTIIMQIEIVAKMCHFHIESFFSL